MAQGKYRDERFSKDLVRAAAEFIEKRWLPDPPLEWVVCVPSLSRPALVPDRLARHENVSHATIS